MNLLSKLTRRVRRPQSPRPAARKEQARDTMLRRPQSGSEKAEFELLRLHLSEDESLLNWLTASIEDKDVDATHYKEIFQLLRGRLRKELPINHSRLLDDIESNELRRFITRLISEADQDLESVSHAGQCLKTIKRSQLRQQADALREQLKDTEKSGGDIGNILQELKKLKEEESTL